MVDIVMVAADTAFGSRGDQQQMIDWVLCISRRIFSLLTLVLSLAGLFCTKTPISLGCSLCSLLGAVIPYLLSRNCRFQD
jgi:uncharacterized membrane protein YjgN (DUF898 family)